MDYNFEVRRATKKLPVGKRESERDRGREKPLNVVYLTKSCVSP